MKTIAFYISNHGFGHASRNIPIIESLLTKCKDIKVIIKCGKNQIDFMKQLLGKYFPRVAFYEEDIDLGLVLKQGRIEVDKSRLQQKLEKFISSWDEKIKKGNSFLLENRVDLVISDIVPWIFKCCKEQSIKSILISNFTWVEIYNELFNNDIYNTYLQCYKMAEQVWFYPLYGYIRDYIKNPKYIGLCCRKFNDENVESIKEAHKQPIVFVSVGRSVNLKDDINVEELPYDFIYTEGINLKGENTYKLPIDTLNTQDYIKAADYVITKAGWTTASEAICAKKLMLVIERNEIAEDRATLENLIKLDIALPIKHDEFNNDNISRLLIKLKEKASSYNNLPSIYNNSVDEIANDILKSLTYFKE
ncbi:glycosyltransferase family protein [Clostridium sp. BSD9I1]|uniref:glycosyltransferase family protein n=1 Tax=Clostridium sp. BSD9I1 TaxID=2003589 RepID=UPI0016457C86|nr:glycosyltransferase family protein [Clostridium sp. BSD9I1]